MQPIMPFDRSEHDSLTACGVRFVADFSLEWSKVSGQAWGACGRPLLKQKVCGLLFRVEC